MGKFMHHHCAATAEVAAQAPEQPAFQPWLVRWPRAPTPSTLSHGEETSAFQSISCWCTALPPPNKRASITCKVLVWPLENSSLLKFYTCFFWGNPWGQIWRALTSKWCCFRLLHSCHNEQCFKFGIWRLIQLDMHVKPHIQRMTSFDFVACIWSMHVNATCCVV